MKKLYKYFFRGLITVLPVALTLYLLYIFLAWTEKLTLWVLSPIIGGFYIPGMGLVSGVPSQRKIFREWVWPQIEAATR